MRVLLCFLLVFAIQAADRRDFRGTHFIGLDRFDRFERTQSENGQITLSSKIDPQLDWDELIISWNFRAAPSNSLVIDAKALYPTRQTKWYSFGQWSLAPNETSRRSSIRGQKDEDGFVDTDTLKLKETAKAALIRITLAREDANALKFVGLSFCNSKFDRPLLPPNKESWGKMLNVKERSQANYPEGINEWCSPTSVSMLMTFWSEKLNRPELDYDVPEVARGVHDPGWPGTGNWPFNTAFAGTHHGIRGYVTRLSDVSELEQWVAAGIPVAVSVSYGYLKGQPEKANGHLVVCVGFDSDGNIIVNDPGRRMVRQTYLRENLIKAWAESENTVYIVHPENWTVPTDRFGHWFQKN